MKIQQKLMETPTSKTHKCFSGYIPEPIHIIYYVCNKWKGFPDLDGCIKQGTEQGQLGLKTSPGSLPMTFHPTSPARAKS